MVIFYRVTPEFNCESLILRIAEFLYFVENNFYDCETVVCVAGHQISQFLEAHV